MFAKKYKQLEHFSYCEDEDFEYYVYGFIGEEWHDEVIKVGKKDVRRYNKHVVGIHFRAETGRAKGIEHYGKDRDDGDCRK